MQIMVRAKQTYDSPLKPIEAVAIRAYKEEGYGNCAVCWAAKDRDGVWHNFTKKQNPGVKFPKVTLTWEVLASEVIGVRICRRFVSNEIPLN